jgi:small subunit ribosomal protein S5e
VRVRLSHNLTACCACTPSAARPSLNVHRSYDDIEIEDISLSDYLAVGTKHATFLPHTAGRYQKKRFRKATCPLVERLTVCLMRKGRNSGKKLLAARVVRSTLEIIHLLTDENPLQVTLHLSSCLSSFC